MSQTPSENTENTEQSATERANQMLNQAGMRIGILAATARARLQQATTQIRAEADHMDQITPDGIKVSAENGHAAKRSETTTSASTSSTAAHETAPPTTDRAEQMVDVAAQRASHVAASVSFNIQKAWARAREEAEDILADAQAMRQHNNR